MNTPRVHLLPASADLLGHAAQHLVATHRARLPDLSGVHIVLPYTRAAPALRRALAAQAQRGLLGPGIDTLAVFVRERAAHITGLSALDCRLHLTGALTRHHHLFAGVGVADAADALYALFEELIAHGLDLGDEAALAARLQTAYRTPAPAMDGLVPPEAGTYRRLPLAFLSREAKIAHLLFSAYLDDTGRRSPAAVYREQLQAAFATLSAETPLHLLGFDQFLPAERAVLKPALADGRAELWLQGRCEGRDGAAVRTLCEQLGVTPAPLAGPASALSVLLDAAFSDDDGPQRPPAARPRLRLVHAADPEHEARCVDLAVREALLDGRSVAVVAADRRLARRLRALLARANVPLDDPAGWALSTSSAAATLDAWFDCLAEDFPFRPLLTLLKSSFLAADADAVRELEQERVFGDGIERGLEAFRAHVAADTPLALLLGRLHEAQATMPDWQRPQAGEVWCDALRASLVRLGLWPRLQADAAGRRLTQLIEALGRVLRGHRLRLDGDGFRALLDRQFERETFVPDPLRSPVRLLTLDQCQNLRCDRLVLAGATREHLPGRAPTQPLFNDAVRSQLGLPSWKDGHALQLARLRRLLESAGETLITCAPATAGEDVPVSPWVAALESTAQGAGHALRDERLPALAARGDADISLEDPAPLPHKAERASVSAAGTLLPEKISATAHQSLVDCPYRFFAGSMLGLHAAQAPDEDPDRSEYGQRVHRILERFTDPVNEDTRAAAQATLLKIADAVFAPDLRTHALAQLWVAEFRSRLPDLLDWLQQRPALLQVQTEQKLERRAAAFVLSGKVDRLESRRGGGQTVVDFKTGAVATKAEVESGEDVQLLHYAALAPTATAAEYLPLKQGQRPVRIDEALAVLRDAALQRLEKNLNAIAAGAPLPAHGDEAVCEHCDYRGLCRRDDLDG